MQHECYTQIPGGFRQSDAVMHADCQAFRQKEKSFAINEQHGPSERSTSTSPRLWREKVAGPSKTKIPRDGIAPWEDRAGSKSTSIWLPWRSCCAKPVARSCYQNDTLVGPVRSRTPLRTSPVSNDPQTQRWLFDPFVACGVCECVCVWVCVSADTHHFALCNCTEFCSKCL